MQRIIRQNIAIMGLSKGFSFVLFLYIAKQLSQEEYGSYIYIIMVLSLMPLLQFGSRHGATVLLPKAIAKKDGCDEDVFLNYSSVSIIIQAFSIVVLLFLNLEVGTLSVLAIGVTFFLLKLVENAQLKLNSNMEMASSNVIKAVDQVFRPVLTFAFFLYFNTLSSVFWGQLAAVAIAFGVSLFYVPLTFKLKLNLNLLKRLYKVGFFIYLIWATDILFRTADRWFISQFYEKGDLATYGFVSSFSMNLWILSLAFIAPYAQLMYKNVSESNFSAVNKLIGDTNKKLYYLMSATFLGMMVVYPIIVDHVLHKYRDTFLLMLVLALVSIFLSLNNMYIYYMNINEMHFVLLRRQMFVLIVNLASNMILAYLHLGIVYFGFSTFMCLVLYFLMVRSCYKKDIKKKLDSLV